MGYRSGVQATNGEDQEAGYISDGVSPSVTGCGRSIDSNYRIVGNYFFLMYLVLNNSYHEDLNTLICLTPHMYMYLLPY